MNTLLDDVIKHMTPERAFECHYPELVSVISRIVTHMKDFPVLFSMVRMCSVCGCCEDVGHIKLWGCGAYESVRMWVCEVCEVVERV